MDVTKLLHLLEDYLDEYNISHTNSMNLGRSCCECEALRWAIA
jgi:hypothetical protein